MTIAWKLFRKQQEKKKKTITSQFGIVSSYFTFMEKTGLCIQKDIPFRLFYIPHNFYRPMPITRWFFSFGLMVEKHSDGEFNLPINVIQTIAIYI